MPNGGIDPLLDYVSELAKDKQIQWPAIATAQSNAKKVQDLLYEHLREFTSDDVDIVVFGSLARREWTSGSDVDWTMLIDGQASTEHRIISRRIQNALETLEFNGIPLKSPGTEGVFGKMAFGHEIVHHIGGQADTNHNTTQRILLLLEAVTLRDSENVLGPCERIVRQVLNRYLVSDSNFHTKTDNESRIPRFLMNDIVRYWRTMCVDFAYKDWERDGKGWALRNIKLRTSRKIMFVAGLMMVFSCFQNDDLQGESDGQLLKFQCHLLNFVHATPLNIIVWALRRIGLDDLCVELIDQYERFLAAINDPSIRDGLTKLSEASVYNDHTFLNCRGISHQLQAVLKKIFFEQETPLREFTCEYGVF